MSTVEDYQNAAQDPAPEQAGDTALLSFDLSRYLADLDDIDISEQQKQELLAILWSIMRGFVELGFNADVCAMVFSGAEAIPSPDNLE